MKVTALAGGVGGAKLINGLHHILGVDLTTIVNTGDDFIHHGLYISPDIDSVIYSLADMNDKTRGWGIEKDTYRTLEELALLGAETWFQIGDFDFATHILRTTLLQNGRTLTEITQILCAQRGISSSILPMTNEKMGTIVITSEYGDIPFQEYFVKYQCQPIIKGIIFPGIENCLPTPEVHHAINGSDLIILCPSNPMVSIAPILNLPGVKDMLFHKAVIGVSPLIGGKVVKGPAAKMFTEMGIEPNSVNFALSYQEILNGWIIDNQDQDEMMEIKRCGIIPFATDILMTDSDAQIRLANDVLNFSTIVFEGKQT